MSGKSAYVLCLVEVLLIGVRDGALDTISLHPLAEIE